MIMSKSTIQPTTTFWIISVIALLWNISGVYAYISQAYMSSEVISTLSEPEQMYYNNVAALVTAAYATAVFAGALGSLTLLLRKKIAYTLFILSFIAVLIQATYNFFIQEFMPVEFVQMIWNRTHILPISGIHQSKDQSLAAYFCICRNCRIARLCKTCSAMALPQPEQIQFC